MCAIGLALLLGSHVKKTQTSEKMLCTAFFRERRLSKTRREFALNGFAMIFIFIIEKKYVCFSIVNSEFDSWKIRIRIEVCGENFSE